MTRREAVKTAVQTYLDGLESCGGTRGNVSAEAIASIVEGVTTAVSEQQTRDSKDAERFRWLFPRVFPKEVANITGRECVCSEDKLPALDAAMCERN